MSLLINSSYAQSVDNFKNYTNNDMNFTIQYPTDWKVKTLGGFTTDDANGISFNTPNRVRDRNDGWLNLNDGVLQVITSNVERYLDTDTMTLKNKTLEQNAQHYRDSLQDPTVPYHEQIIRENKITIGGNDAIKFEYGAKEDNNNKDHYGFRILTIANGTDYVLTYQDEALKVPETLPLANKMVDSFQIKR